jgi:hypothetical protein
MDYEPVDFPIEREPYAVPDQHITYQCGVSMSRLKGEKWLALRAENLRRQQAAKHVRQSR